MNWRTVEKEFLDRYAIFYFIFFIHFSGLESSILLLLLLYCYVMLRRVSIPHPLTTHSLMSLRRKLRGVENAKLGSTEGIGRIQLLYRAGN